MKYYLFIGALTAWSFCLNGQNNSIFSGGIDDGFDFNGFTQPVTNSIFAGGIDDGFDFNGFAQPVTNNIFAGGIDDGFDFSIFAQPVTNSIFAGGIDDGFDFNGFAQPVTNSIFAGGIDDGFDFITFEIPVSELALTVFLQGPIEFGGSDGDAPFMNIALIFLPNFLLLPEPYTALGYTLQNAGTLTVPNPSTVDWVLVELRSAANQVFAARAAILYSDGKIGEPMSLGSDPVVRFRNVPPGNYYIAVRHRNHLGVMTASAVFVGNVP